MRSLVLTVCLSGCFLGRAQAPTPAQPSPGPTIRLTTKEVVLDLVVRDKRGHLVSDLKPEEIKVYEDGVQQKVTSFRNVQGREQLNAERAAARAESGRSDVRPILNSLRELNFISIVFAPMAHGNLAFAREAVETFLKNEVQPNTYITVFRLDTSLRLIQAYTRDRKALADAVHHMTDANFLLNSTHLASDVLIDPSPVANATATSNTSSTSRGTQSPLGQGQYDPRDSGLAQNLSRMDAAVGLNAALQAESSLQDSLRFVDNMASGMTILDQLRALIHSQMRMPGRKVVLFLSDGLRLPAERVEVFQAVISNANRAGVTFYGVDTRGLTAPTGPNQNPLDASSAQMSRVIKNSGMQSTLNSGSMRGSENIQAAMDAGHAADDVQLLAVSNTQLAMQELAERTGGFAVTNTNEIAKPMERVMEEIRTHYELAYSPASDVYDGHFRKIEVKVDRPKAAVQTRGGYYALPDINGEPIQPFEMAALTALNSRPVPNDFPFESALLEYRPGQASKQCEIAFEVPVSSLKMSTDARTGKSRIDASLVALVQDSSGQVIGKISRQIFRDVDAADVETFRKGKIDYAEALDLAPGHYTLATAVLDANGNTKSAHRLAVFVKPAASLGLSTIEVVKRVDPLTGQRNPNDPFEMEDRRVTLTLGEDVAPGNPVDLFFVVYPAGSASSEPPKLVVELFRDGKEAGRMTSDLPKPDSTGVIPMVAELKPPAGRYDVQVTVRQGSFAAQASRAVNVR